MQRSEARNPEQEKGIIEFFIKTQMTKTLQILESRYLDSSPLFEDARYNGHLELGNQGLEFSSEWADPAYRS